MLFKQQIKSMADSIEIEDPREDMKSAKRVGQYKISQKAIYKADNTYLPFSAVKKATHDKSSVHVSGCCAGGVWVERIIFDTDSGLFPFIFDSLNEVSKVEEISGIKIDDAV